MLKAKRDKDDPDVSVKLDGLTDEPPQRLLSRLMTWAGVTLLMVGAAILAARSETGSQRIARLFNPPSPPAPVQIVQRAEPPRPVSAPDTLLMYETRRLAEQVRSLSAEREALAERVAAMERTVGDVTASVSRQDAPAPRPVRVIETAPPAAQPVTAPAPPAAATAPPAGSAPTAAPVPVPNPAPAPPAAAAQPTAAQPVTPPVPEAQESTAIRTEFGVDLAGDPSIEALRARWQQLRNQHGPVLEGLRPVVAVQEGRQGAVELRLVVGPLSNANAATRLCATLSAAGVNCKPAVFDGQRLAVR